VKSLLKLVAASATIALALSSSSCASREPDSQSNSTSTSGQLAPAAFNDADQTFVASMIPHHQQAVDMSALVPQRSTNEPVIKLANDVSAAQEPEIQVLKVLQVQWSADQTDQHQGPHDVPMKGMVDPATMTKLESLQGAEFDTLWLQSMIAHHEGAIEMAQTEIASGANDDAKRLAQGIVTTQQGEITQMKQILGG
jgi:uncharacterized protein (DUF305 family)